MDIKCIVIDVGDHLAIFSPKLNIKRQAQNKVQFYIGSNEDNV